MSTMHSATKYVPSPSFYICTNARCPQGVPSWKHTGTPSRRRCRFCGQTVRKCKSEPRR